jgi:hypothetical protein
MSEADAISDMSCSTWRRYNLDDFCFVVFRWKSRGHRAGKGVNAMAPLAPLARYGYYAVRSRLSLTLDDITPGSAVLAFKKDATHNIVM